RRAHADDGFASRTEQYAPTSGMNTAITPGRIRPFRKVTATNATHAAATAIEPTTEPTSSRPNGRTPITTSPAKDVDSNTASTDDRPSSDQYTSSRWS